MDRGVGQPRVRDPFGTVPAPYLPHEDDAVRAILYAAKRGEVAPAVAEREVRVLHWLKATFDATIDPGVVEEDPAPRRAVDANTFTRTRKGAPSTSSAAAKKAYPRTGTQRRAIFDAIGDCGERGATDYELEVRFGWKHQSVSATRNGLVADGWVADSGKRRETDSGAFAVVWVLASGEESR